MCKGFIDYCYEKENELSTLVDVNGNTLDLCKHLYVDVSDNTTNIPTNSVYAPVKYIKKIAT